MLILLERTSIYNAANLLPTASALVRMFEGPLRAWVDIGDHCLPTIGPQMILLAKQGKDAVPP